MKIPLKAPAIVLIAWLIFSGMGGSSALEILIKWGLFLSAAALAYGWWKTRHAGKPKVAVKDFPAEEKAWLKSVRKNWVSSLDLVGLVAWVPGKNASMPAQAQAPRLLSCRPVPLGVEMDIEILAGRQSQAAWISARENLASAWGRELRITPGTNPREVVVLIEFGSPLEEARDSADTMTEDDWDTKEWGGIRNA